MPKILIVDDDLSTVFTVKKILEKSGYKTIWASSGKDALELLEMEKADLILLDVMMPEMDGWEVSKRIKENKKTGTIPVAMLTVKGAYEDRVKSFQDAHADAHITKPFVTEELLKIVELLLAYRSKGEGEKKRP